MHTRGETTGCMHPGGGRTRQARGTPHRHGVACETGVRVPSAWASTSSVSTPAEAKSTYRTVVRVTTFCADADADADAHAPSCAWRCYVQMQMQMQMHMHMRRRARHDALCACARARSRVCACVMRMLVCMRMCRPVCMCMCMHASAACPDAVAVDFSRELNREAHSDQHHQPPRRRPKLV